ncbi:trehalose-phosphatase [Eleftheria terrae]|uniref:trehalose-phosphatase n=1 Tax=Eleftheria terrae TaxID=1597781 RepID=UPI00263AFCCC|nr:trehalose-phosphatase [Eleftheria terrae]WKB51248.1 trehalose-phosphatase [Eleftheria terrae]
MQHARFSPSSPLSLPALDTRSALFLDFDGTLAELAPRPDAVRVPPELIDTLRALHQALQGAIAIVSGRPVAQLDALLAPLHLASAGVHGVERRSADGYLQRLPAPDGLILVQQRADALAAELPGLLVEHKPGALALHYRQRPQARERCVEVMEAAVREAGGLTLLHGKMVLEAKPEMATKGHAIAAFLREPPFLGRRPLFAGDDVTDEAGFAAVQAAGGDTLKIGEGETAAVHRLADPAALRSWLARCAAQLAAQPTGSADGG